MYFFLMQMQKENFQFWICSLIILLISSCNAENWQESWLAGVNYFSKDKFEQAQQEFTKAIEILEIDGNKDHPYVYNDRGMTYRMLKDYNKALSDFTTAMNSDKIKPKDKINAVSYRMMTYVILGLQEETFKDLDYLKEIDQEFPRAEFSDDKIIIRNLPSCKCFIKALKSLLIHSGMCESETDIQIFESGICVVKRKFNCGCQESQNKENHLICMRNLDIDSKDLNDYNNCVWYCDKAAFAAFTLCAVTFKNPWCIGQCQVLVEMLREGCHWCCGGGGLYQNCIKPFEDYIKDVGCQPNVD